MCRKHGINCAYNLPPTKKRQIEYRNDISGENRPNDIGFQYTSEGHSRSPKLVLYSSAPVEFSDISFDAGTSQNIETGGLGVRDDESFDGHVSLLHNCHTTTGADSVSSSQMNAVRRLTLDTSMEDPIERLHEFSYHDMHTWWHGGLVENEPTSNDRFDHLDPSGGQNDQVENFELRAHNMPENHSSRTDSNRPKICSINDAPGVTGLYIGLGGELDPYLLRYFKYDENHQRQYFKVNFLKAADPKDPSETARSPLSKGDSSWFAAHSPDAFSRGDTDMDTLLGEIPVQFMLNSDELAEEEKKDTTFRASTSSESLRHELDQMVSPEDGLRLINL